jgi:hypothetical protein
MSGIKNNKSNHYYNQIPPLFNLWQFFFENLNSAQLAAKIKIELKGATRGQNKN